MKEPFPSTVADAETAKDFPINFITRSGLLLFEGCEEQTERQTSGYSISEPFSPLQLTQRQQKTSHQFHNSIRIVILLEVCVEQTETNFSNKDHMASIPHSGYVYCVLTSTCFAEHGIVLFLTNLTKNTSKQYDYIVVNYIFALQSTASSCEVLLMK